MKKKVIEYVTQSKLYVNLISLLKRFKFRRYDNMTLYEVIKVFVKNLVDDDIIERANGVAFNFTLAIFPAVIFLFTLIPYVQLVIPGVSEEGVLEFLGNEMPANMYETVKTTVQDIVGNTRGGLLTFGALFSLYLATNGMMSLMNAFNACYKTEEKRGFLKRRFIATLLTIMLAFSLILASILLVIGNVIIGYLGSIEFAWMNVSDYQIYLFLILRFLVLFTIYFLAISFIYYFGPTVHYNWRFFSIGSLIATTLGILVTYGFSFYVSNFATYNKLYGSLGVLIALMIWQQILGITLLVGYEVNASIHSAYSLKEVDSPNFED